MSESTGVGEGEGVGERRRSPRGQMDLSMWLREAHPEDRLVEQKQPRMDSKRTASSKGHIVWK